MSLGNKIITFCQKNYCLSGYYLRNLYEIYDNSSQENILINSNIEIMNITFY